MGMEEQVVVVLPVTQLVHLVHKDGKHFVTRIPALGLTAYGDSDAESTKKVKHMFAAFVVAHRKNGSLVERLNKSKLEWYWKKDYKGNSPVELISIDGTITIKVLNPEINESPWRNILPRELVMAY